MKMQIKKAQRKQAKLRIWFSSPSGAGKTMSSLLIAKWLVGEWNKICVIDTENGSADLYSQLWEYNTLTLESPYTPERYIQAIKTAEEAGMECIIIDSITHEWDTCLEENDKLAFSKYRWNTWSAWSVTTPRHQKFIDTILQSKCHILTTVRNKTDMIQVKEWDKTKIQKVWIKEVTRDWFEYELTINFSIDRDTHFATASKDRTWLFSDTSLILDEKVWEMIREWNLSWVSIFEMLKKELEQSKNIDDLKINFTNIFNKKNQLSESEFIELEELKNTLKNKFE